VGCDILDIRSPSKETVRKLRKFKLLMGVQERGKETTRKLKENKEERNK
jgi:hypothetical protein